MESNKNNVENIKMLFGNFLDSVTGSNSELLRREEELRRVTAVMNEKIIQLEDRVAELEQRILAIEEGMKPGNTMQVAPAEPAVEPEAEPAGMPVTAEPQLPEEEPMFILEDEPETEPVVIAGPENPVAEPDQMDMQTGTKKEDEPAKTEEAPEIIGNIETESGSGEPEVPAPDKGTDLFSGISQKEEKRTILEAARPDWYDWEVDYPASYIEDIAGGIGFNDKILFLKELFRNDEVLFSTVIKTLNEMGSFREAVGYMRENFPEWNEGRDEVYRFYMNVRRKLRK